LVEPIEMYQILRDFAGPVATIIASITAAFITWRFASWQARIAQQQAETAKQQANTAFDQLRYNLFEKRFAIYNTARELVALVVNKSNVQGSEVVPLHAKLNEAEFFFLQRIFAIGCVSSARTAITFLFCDQQHICRMPPPVKLPPEAPA
jgi:type II secretory pathway pseudopilin PulG